MSRSFPRTLGPWLAGTSAPIQRRLLVPLTTLALAAGAGLTACTSGSGLRSPGQPFPCVSAAPVDITSIRDLSRGFGSVDGQVLSSGSEPIIGARVSILDSTGALIPSALTDRLGQFSIDSVSAGLRTVRIEFIGYETQDHYTRIVPNAKRMVCAILQERPVHLMPVRASTNHARRSFEHLSGPRRDTPLRLEPRKRFSPGGRAGGGV